MKKAIKTIFMFVSILALLVGMVFVFRIIEANTKEEYVISTEDLKEVCVKEYDERTSRSVSFCYEGEDVEELTLTKPGNFGSVFGAYDFYDVTINGETTEYREDKIDITKVGN